MLLGPKRFFPVPSALISFDRIAKALRGYHNDAVVGQSVAKKMHLHAFSSQSLAGSEYATNIRTRCQAFCFRKASFHSRRRALHGPLPVFASELFVRRQSSYEHENRTSDFAFSCLVDTCVSYWSSMDLRSNSRSEVYEKAKTASNVIQIAAKAFEHLFEVRIVDALEGFFLISRGGTWRWFFRRGFRRLVSGLAFRGGLGRGIRV